MTLWNVYDSNRAPKIMNERGGVKVQPVMFKPIFFDLASEGLQESQDEIMEVVNQEEQKTASLFSRIWG